MSDQPVRYGVWAIECTLEDRKTKVLAVSAESEFGAIKRLCGTRAVVVLRVEKTDRKPQWEQRRVEGFIDYEFSPDTGRWEYT